MSEQSKKAIWQACYLFTAIGSIALVCEGFWSVDYWEVAGGICGFYMVALNFRTSKTSK